MFGLFVKRKKGFTLVEMLIVIVIIGLLAASLIPKLTGMQAKARDTVRRTDISQLGTAIQVYYTDNGTFPGTSTGGQSTDHIKEEMSQYLKSLPKDPQNTRVFNGVLTTVTKTPGYYMYTPVMRNGIANASFALMAGMEEVGGSVNWVYSTAYDGGGFTQGEINTGADFLDLVELTCVRVRKGAVTSLNTGANEDDKCRAQEKVDNLRYLYIN